MKLWDNSLKIWKILSDTSPEGEKKPPEIKEWLQGKHDYDEKRDKHFCIGDSDWCVL